MERNVVVASELDRAEHQDTTAGGGHLEHLVEADPGETPSVGDDAGISAEDAGHVGVDLADGGVQGCAEGHGGDIGAASAEGGDVLLRRDALEARHHRHDAIGDRRGEPVRPDLEDLGSGVVGVGDNPGLAASERRRLDAEVGQRHAQQAHRDPLA